MKKGNILYIFVLAVAVAGSLFFITSPGQTEKTEADTANSAKEAVKSESSVRKASPQVVLATSSLAVPYMSEAPAGIWSGPWKNACEEDSIFMVDKYYEGKKTASASDAETFMKKLFDAEDAKYGSNVNSDAERTLYLIDTYSSFTGTIKTNPTLDDIKKEIVAGHPVISFHRGFDLHNPNIPFLPTGSAYHVMVIIGYDDTTKEFLTNDPGDTIDGAKHRYSYSLFMNSLHDYNYVSKKADGEPAVIFTSGR